MTSEDESERARTFCPRLSERFPRRCSRSDPAWPVALLPGARRCSLHGLGRAPHSCHPSPGAESRDGSRRPQPQAICVFPAEASTHPHSALPKLLTLTTPGHDRWFSSDAIGGWLLRGMDNWNSRAYPGP